MKPLSETSFSFVVCLSSLSHNHSLNLPVSYKHIIVFTNNKVYYRPLPADKKIGYQAQNLKRKLPNITVSNGRFRFSSVFQLFLFAKRHIMLENAQ